MKYLLVVAHGSRREASNEEVRQLAARMDLLKHEFDAVGSAFLELTEPLIPDGIRQAVIEGAHEIVVLPYFLSAGRHVVTDVPAEVDLMRKEFPKINISMAPYFGTAESIPTLLLDQAAQANVAHMQNINTQTAPNTQG